jgi:hypothetical protein
MKSLKSIIHKLVGVRPAAAGSHFAIAGLTYFANEAAKVAVTLFLPNQLAPRQEGKDHWVQLSPFGDFGNANGSARVIQRFRKEDAEHICNEFNSTIRRVTQPLGMPFYIGHPDHPRFKGQPGHEDPRAYGRGKEMAVRHDGQCAGCAAFGNGKTDEPCQEHGLFVKMHWNDEGARLITNESFHGHSVNWAAVPDGMENGVQVYRPIRVKSAGFTNEPNIPVRPASLANAEAGTAAASSDERELVAQSIVPPRLKLLAGFKEDEEVTMEQVLDALEKARPVDGARPVEKANEADRARALLEEQLANERRARATAVVDGLVKAGRVVTKDRAGCIEQLCNAGDKFDEIRLRMAGPGQAVKTIAVTTGLANAHARVIEGERERTARFQQLMDARQKELPNESYEERFRAIGTSHEGAQLFAQMKKPGAEE